MAHSYSTPKCKASIALLSLVMIWTGTVVMTFWGIPEIAGVSLVDNAGNELTDNAGNIMLSSSDLQAMHTRRLYYYYAIPSILLISLGMAFQGVESIQTIMAEADRDLS